MSTVQCPQCDGTAQDSDDRPCKFCNGMGKMSHEEFKRKFPTLIPTKMNESLDEFIYKILLDGKSYKTVPRDPAFSHFTGLDFAKKSIETFFNAQESDTKKRLSFVIFKRDGNQWKKVASLSGKDGKLSETTKMSEFKTIIKEAYLVTEDYHTAANDFHHGWIELRKLMVQKTGGYKGAGYNDPRMAQAKQLYEKLSDIIDDIMK